MGFNYARYSYNDFQERILNIGQAGSSVLFIPALFTESNRLRALTVTIMRKVSDRGFRCLLPDLPGTLESNAALQCQGLADWDKALAAAVSRTPVHIVAIRGGCLLGGEINPISRWHFAPLAGEKLMRELFRARQAALRERGQMETLAGIEADSAGNIVELAGERVAPALSTPLKAAVPPQNARLRTLRLDNDPAGADRHIVGPALWRRSEPESDDPLAALLAADIVEWVSQ